MAEETCMEVKRLDRAQPPPGYEVGIDLSSHGRAMAVAACWARYERECDPPGLTTLDVRMSGLWCPYVQHADGLYPAEMLVRDADTQERARAYAWSYYWRRAALVQLFERASEIMKVPAFPIGKEAVAWADILTWPDDKVASMEREVAAMIHREAEKRAKEVLRA